MNDFDLLAQLCARGDRLQAREREAFADMHKRMGAGRLHALSFAQRAWAQEAAARVGLDVQAPADWRRVAAEVKGSGQRGPSAWEPDAAKSFGRRSRSR
jgi:hypothetical protein